jgi:hypothetical protein
MAFLVSPGVQVKETDLTNVIPATSSSIGAIAGKFQWGPVDEIVTVGSEQQLVETFGASSPKTFQCFMNAAQFLSYGNTLRTVRVVGSAALNASVSGTGVLAKNDDHFDTLTIAETNWAIAKFPGQFGSSVGISVCSSAEFATWTFATHFTGAPGTSDGVLAVGGANDEVHIVIYDHDGSLTGAVNTVLETFEYASQAIDAKSPDGLNNYFINVLNARSSWVRAGAVPATEFPECGDLSAGTTFTSTALAGGEMAGGVADNTNVGLPELEFGYEKFTDPETVEISLIIQSDDVATLDATLVNLADARKDCVAFVSPAIADTVGVTTGVADTVATWGGGFDSSYGFADSGAIYVYDKYQDTFRWLLASGSMAGLAANADNVADPWWSPAGFSRGTVRNVTRLAFNPIATDRDTLYKAGVNPIVSFAGQGTILYGDKTTQSKPSAFDRINVRRLFITLEKAISVASKFQLFEFNDEFTRAQFRNMVEPFLRDIKGRRGITDFRVVCDDTNNTGDIIDTNRFVADIYIKPARSINFITLNFIATRTGVEFSEIAGGN